mmetsp:Transcript_54550/g.154532  ORF Transcript_54550/g.154532 Transcript_54550/m.154532 type:complete len:234 (-) Transcript_54550:34-735(-)
MRRVCWPNDRLQHVIHSICRRACDCLNAFLQGSRKTYCSNAKGIEYGSRRLLNACDYRLSKIQRPTCHFISKGYNAPTNVGNSIALKRLLAQVNPTSADPSSQSSAAINQAFKYLGGSRLQARFPYSALIVLIHAEPSMRPIPAKSLIRQAIRHVPDPLQRQVYGIHRPTCNTAGHTGGANQQSAADADRACRLCIPARPLSSNANILNDAVGYMGDAKRTTINNVARLTHHH